MNEQRNSNNFSEEVRKDIRRRYTVVVLLFFIPILMIFGTILKVQLVEGKAWRDLGEKSKMEDVLVPSNRGNILSQDGQLMASTVPYYALYMDFQAVDQDTFFHYLNPLCKKLSRHFGDKTPGGYRQHLLKGYKKQSREYLISKKKVSHMELKEIKRFPLFKKGRYQSGLYEKKYLQRQKPFGSLASRTIGDIYGDFNKGGKNGLELRYDSLLRGQPGVCVRQKVAGKFMGVNERDPVDGIDLVTTIDIHIQDIVETALGRELRRINATSGTVVLMEVETGEVRAICNLGLTPSGGYYETQNYAVSDQSEPGSTFKTFSMMVALEDGMVHPKDSVETGNGVKVMYGRNMTDHNANHGGYHTITAEKSIWFSSNIGVSTLIDKHYRSQPCKFVDGLYRMGLNKRMNLEIPGSGRPFIPYPVGSKRYWAKTDLPWMSIGYVTQIPPIYTLAFYNAIANHGKLIRPFFVKAFSRNGEVVQKFETQVLNEKICSDKTLTQIRLMLDSVVGHGTGSGARSQVVAIAGKTGTAQLSKGVSGYQQGGKTHQVSFCGYFPADKPRYSCIVVIREPKNEIPSGGKQAGGVFREVAEKIYAQNLRLIPGRADSTETIEYPFPKSGNLKSLKEVLAQWNVSYSLDASSKTKWVRSKTDKNGILLTSAQTRKWIVPDVKDMGARDAVYLLGNSGLNVSISGKGKVVSQSIPAGSFYYKGQHIELVME
ncbi:MAG: penicillin-binding protein [Bacteroidales bacterium]|nr:penicillin-binding protein [Bacteroidales bacterium]